MASLMLAGSITISATVVLTEERQHKAVIERMNRLLDTVESTVRIACFVKDAKLADEVAQGLLKNREVYAVAIETDETDLVRTTLSDARLGAIPSHLRLQRDIRSPFDNGKVIGRIRVDANQAAIERDVYDEVRFVALQIGTQLVFIALTVAAVMLMFIVRPIKAISDRLHRMDATRGERLAMPARHAHTEIGRLADDINGLADSLAAALDQERTLRRDKEMEERKYHSIFENAKTGIFIAQADGTLTSWNPAFARLMGIPPRETHDGTLNLRQLPWESVARAAQLTVDCQGQHDLADDLAIRTRDGGRRWVNVVLTSIGDHLMQGVVHDVTEHKEAEASAKRLAVSDGLTGLANRLGLEEQLHRRLRTQSIQKAGGFTLMLVDLDNFRRINEGIGLPVGDAVLKDTGARLGNCLKNTDTVARLGGDRFALVLESVIGGDDIGQIASRILDTIRKPFHVDGSPLQVQASIGITTAPRDGTEVPELLRNAELALDRAKATGGNAFVFFDPALARAAEQRRQIENDLRRARRNGELRLFYQPIVDLSRNRLAGAEALVRWQHPEHGLVPPDAFIPLAEETGLIEEIGLWTLEVACGQLAAWQRAGLDRYLSLNVSARQIPDGLPPAALLDAVERHRVAPSSLALEITEGVLMADIDKAQAWVDAVHGHGFRIYLDDFGTGYSSLSYLKRFPIDTLKVDKSFVRDMSHDSSDRALIEAVIAMAGGLGMSVVAEGVETSGQLDLLRGMHCHHAQGYLFSRPVPADQFEAVAHQIEEFFGRLAAPA